MSTLAAAIKYGNGFRSIDASTEELPTPGKNQKDDRHNVYCAYSARRETLPENDYKALSKKSELDNYQARVRFLSEPSQSIYTPQSPSVHRKRTTTGWAPNRNRRRHISRQLTGQLNKTASMTLLTMRELSQRTFSTVDTDDENPERGTWSSQMEFFLSCLGYAVGLGNVWRFPYLCHKNGGGAFLLPYFLALAFCGLPILFLELSLGQFSSEGPITIWKLSPLFSGIGIGVVMVSIFLAIYYNVVTGWAIYYIYASLNPELAWRCCGNTWNTPDCVSFSSGCNNSSVAAPINFTYSADEFFHSHVLNISAGITDVGGIQGHLFLGLLLAWLSVFFVLMKGIKSFGKVVYFTSSFPYLVLLILGVRAVIEPGAMKGIKYYLAPQWGKLLEAEVWSDAVTQIFFSTSICTGGIITLASYNRFSNNCFRDAIIIGLGNSMTSLFSGFVVFSILGFMAERQGAEVKDVVKDGPGLTFIIYPQAVTLLPMSPLWSVLFFLMLVTLALSSMFPTVENITTAVIDLYKILRPYKLWVTFLSCIIFFSLGVLLVTRAGMYVLVVMDKFAVGYALILLGLLEVLVFAWRYGAERVYSDIQAMTSIKLSAFWKFTWKFLCPLLLIFSLTFSWIDFEPLAYPGTGYVYPSWYNGIGWLLSLSSFSAIPIYGIYYCWKNRHIFTEGIWQAVFTLSEPLPSWGPALPQHRQFIGIEDDDVFG